MTLHRALNRPKRDPDGQRLQRLIHRRRMELGLIPDCWRKSVIRLADCVGTIARIFL